MSLDLCEMSLQLTQGLLRFTDTVLQQICCRRFSSYELYVEALQHVLGGEGRRGPASIFIGFQEDGGHIRRGRVFHLRKGTLVEGSEEIAIDAGAIYAGSLAVTESPPDLVISNWADSGESLDDYQHFIPSAIGIALAAPIRNFITYRISGDAPGALIAFNFPGRATDYDADVLRGLGVVIGSLITLSSQVRETEKAFIYTIEALARACEAAEEHTGRHILRVNRYAGALAAAAGAPVEFVESVSFSAQMHDVGKIKIPVALLLKEGPLTDEEMELMKMHPVFGERILGDSPRLQVAREIAIAHHENWDGSGYPYGLRGDGIPLAGRIVRIADVYDALRSRRSYKSPMGHGDAVRVFREGDGRIRPKEHFDPELLRLFFSIEHMFESIYTVSEQEIAN